MHIVSRRQNKPPARIGALSVLPVFFNLQDKCVVLAGSSAALAWKAELLSAAGSKLDIYVGDEEVSDELSEFVEGRSQTDRVQLHAIHWRDADFRGAAIALGDVAPEEAADFVAKARNACVPVNVIDQPDFCDFQFGSIVNRSPIVVSISTSGAAPVLAQAVRRRIEMLLPQNLGAWGRVAQSLRAKVMQKFPDSGQRRLFWDRFVTRVFSGAPDIAPDAAGLLNHAAHAIAGRVTLTGIGPGDADLLTVKAVRAMQSADVILFDSATPPEVLELARREAKRTLIETGQFNEWVPEMEALAKSGKQIVRLISGDPTTQSEATQLQAVLRARGIAVSMVAGVHDHESSCTRVQSQGRATAFR